LWDKLQRDLQNSATKNIENVLKGTVSQ